MAIKPNFLTSMGYHIFLTMVLRARAELRYLTIILRGRAGYEMIYMYITNEARSAELVMIISYPASPSRIIVLLKTPTSQLFYVEFIWPFFLGAAKLCICCCVLRPYLVVQVYELITCVRRANENAGNVISVVQFLIKMYIPKQWIALNARAARPRWLATQTLDSVELAR